MSELNINDLPCEILTKIFRFLDAVNLKKATLACRLWNNLIESECRWSLNLDCDDNNKLWCTHNAEQKMEFIKTTNRKFEAIKINGSRLSADSPILLLLQRHGFNVVELTLCYYREENLTAVAELLNLTPNLNHVKMIMHGFNSNAQLGQISPELKKLKSLDIHVNDHRIVQYFRKTKLRRFRILETKSKEHGPLLDFILSQDALTTLTVLTLTPFASPSILAKLGKSYVPFQLTQLAISGLVDDQDQNNLLKFVKSQAKTLVELEIGVNFLSFVYECIIESMPKLNTLSVIASPGLSDIDNIEGLKTNDSIRTIKLVGSLYNDRGFQLFGKFLKKLPNVRSLILLQSVHLNKIIRSLDKLESIAIRTSEHSFNKVGFPNLKTLHIQDLRKRIDWNEFTEVHSLLTELTIERMNEHSYLTSDDINQITTNVDLQHITLGVGFVADDRFFEIIRTKCANLKVLDLHRSCLPQGLNENVGINVLRLCHDIKYSEKFCTAF